MADVWPATGLPRQPDATPPFPADASRMQRPASASPSHGDASARRPPGSAEAVPPLPPLPPLAAATPRLGHRLMRLTEQGIALWALGVQLLTWRMTAAGLAPHEHRHQATMVLIEATYLLALLLLPEPLWLQHRLTLLGAARIGTGLVPCSRSASEGTAVLLRRTATEGWLGALLDWLRVGGATRLLVHAGCGMVVKMPPLVLLAQQVVMMALSANPRGYCTTPLLSHPLTRRRLHRVWATFDAVPTVVPHIEDFKPASEAERALAECMAVLTMQQALLGVLLPLAVAVAVHSGRRGGAEQQWGPAPQQQDEQHAAGERRGWQSRVLAAAAAWRRGWARADDALTSALTLDREELEVSGPQLLLCLWMLLGNAWMLCKAAAVRSLGDPFVAPGQV